MSARASIRHGWPRLRPLAACLATVLAAAASPGTVHARNIPVTSCVDDHSSGSLRWAFTSSVSGDTIDLTQLTCSTISLVHGPIDTSLFGSHPVDILTVNGPGRDALTIDGGNSPIFVAGAVYGYHQSRFTLNDLTVAHGATHKYFGAGCISMLGDLVLNRTTVTDCHAYLSWFSGAGAILANGLYLTDSTISNSSVTAADGYSANGGGAYAGRATLIDSTISGNRVIAQAGVGWSYETGGGGLFVLNDLTLVDSTISGNSVKVTNSGEVGRGGGAYVRGTATIKNSTIAGNSADGDGGGLYNYRCCSDPHMSLTVQGSTISGNSADGAGGGLATNGEAMIGNSTIAFNASASGGAVMFRLAGLPEGPGAGALDLESSILAGDTAGGDAAYAADLATDGTLTVTGASSLVIAADAAITLPADTLQSDPQLRPLGWNGGPTRTHALVAGSPAIDAGNNPANLTTDQRGDGFPRVFGTIADIGAFEYKQELLAPIIAKTFTPRTVAAGETSQLTITLTNNNAGAATLNATLVDAFPISVVVANPPNASTTCLDGVLAADAGAAKVSLGVAAIIPAVGSCVVTVSVTADGAGAYQNVIPVGALQTDRGSNVAAASAMLEVTQGLPVDRVFSNGFDGALP